MSASEPTTVTADSSRPPTPDTDDGVHVVTIHDFIVTLRHLLKHMAAVQARLVSDEPDALVLATSELRTAIHCMRAIMDAAVVIRSTAVSGTIRVPAN